MKQNQASNVGGRIARALSAVGAGALLTYLFDPDRGNRRRAILRDKVYSAVDEIGNAARVTTKDAGNRARGLVASVRSRLRQQDAPADVLVERVRAKIGRVVSHPGALEVGIANGRVTLRGQILKHEVKAALDAAASVPGVNTVISELEAHDQPRNISSLQGGIKRETRAELLQENWAPTTRALVGLAGAALIYYGLKRRSLGSPLYVAAGVAATARALTNTNLKQLSGLRGRRSVEFRKTLYIDASVNTVYAFWSDFENFPKFMRNVRSVQKRHENAWHWEVAGPLGASVEWDSEITERIPNEVIAWRTLPSATVQHAGIIRFERQNGGTRIDLRMSYNPGIGAVGHLIASLFGANPKTEIDEDLSRMKSFLEAGRQRSDEAQPTKPGVAGASSTPSAPRPSVVSDIDGGRITTK